MKWKVHLHLFYIGLIHIITSSPSQAGLRGIIYLFFYAIFLAYLNLCRWVLDTNSKMYKSEIRKRNVYINIFLAIKRFGAGRFHIMLLLKLIWRLRLLECSVSLRTLIQWYYLLPKSNWFFLIHQWKRLAGKYVFFLHYLI